MFAWILAIFATLILLFILIINYVDGNKGFWAKENISYVHSNQIFSKWDKYTFRIPFHELDNQTYRFFKKQKDLKIGGTTLYRHPLLYILDLDLVRNILVKDFDHFINRRGIEFPDPIFDNILFNMTNQDWKDLRAILTTTFTTSKIKRVFGVFEESSKKMVKFLQSELNNADSEIEMRGVCSRFGMDVIASTAFGVDSQSFENENSQFTRNARLFLVNINLIFIIKFIVMISFPKLANLFQFRFLSEKGTKFFESVLKCSIQRRRELGEKRNDLLQLLLEVQNDVAEQSQIEDVVDQYEGNTKFVEPKKVQKYKLTDTMLIAQCNGIFIAGFDTIESLLMWSCYELAINADVQEKLYKELHLATNGEQKNLTYKCISNLVYLDMVVSETLRMYPPSIRSERKCNKDYKIPNDDYVIKKGTHIIIPTYAIHHDPAIFPNPERFDPERFNSENKGSRHPFTNLAFGMGPRACIAMRFALTEGKTALAHLMLNFKFSPTTKTDILMKFSLEGMLKPQNGMTLKVESRY